MGRTQRRRGVVEDRPFLVWCTGRLRRGGGLSADVSDVTLSGGGLCGDSQTHRKRRQRSIESEREESVRAAYAAEPRGKMASRRRSRPGEETHTHTHQRRLRREARRCERRHSHSGSSRADALGNGGLDSGRTAVLACEDKGHHEEWQHCSFSLKGGSRPAQAPEQRQVTHPRRRRRSRARAARREAGGPRAGPNLRARARSRGRTP